MLEIIDDLYLLLFVSLNCVSGLAASVGRRERGAGRYMRCDNGVVRELKNIGLIDRLSLTYVGTHAPRRVRPFPLL